MPVCRSCGKQVGSRGFCFDCMSKDYVVEELTEKDFDRLKIRQDKPLEVHSHPLEDSHAQSSIVYSTSISKKTKPDFRKKNKSPVSTVDKKSPRKKKRIKCLYPFCTKLFKSYSEREKHIIADHLNGTEVDDLKKINWSTK